MLKMVLCLCGRGNDYRSKRNVKKDYMEFLKSQQKTYFKNNTERVSEVIRNTKSSADKGILKDSKNKQKWSKYLTIELKTFTKKTGVTYTKRLIKYTKSFKRNLTDITWQSDF